MFHLYSGMGCFWGAERRFWKIHGVFSTQVGYAGGFTPNPTYQEVCSGESHTHTHPIKRGRSPLEKWHSDTLEYAFQHIYRSQINALPQPLPKHSLCSELPRMHHSLLDPQPLPLLLCDLLVTRQFRRDDMEGGMQL